MIVSRGLSCFHFYWHLVPSLTFNQFLPPLSGRMLTGWIHHRISSPRFHISSWQTSHFHFKKETRLLWLQLPLPAPRSCFWKFIAFLLLLGASLRSRVLRAHLSTGRPAASRRRVCGAASHQFSAMENKTSTLLKRAGSEDVPCGRKEKKNKKPHAGPPRPKITPSF